MRRCIPILLAAVLAAVSCVYPFEPEYRQADELLVVDGDIVIGELCDIVLRKLNPVNEPPYASLDKIPAAEMWIEDSRGKHYGVHENFDAANGRGYRFDLRQAPVDGRQYSLAIKAWDRFYRSDWLDVHAAPEVKGLNYAIAGSDVRIYLSLDPGAEGERHYRWTYRETWEYNAPFLPNMTWDAKHGYRELLPGDVFEYHYCWMNARTRNIGIATSDGLAGDSVNDIKVASISRSDGRMSNMYRMDLTARSISRDCYDYLSAVVASSEGTGDLFTPTPSAIWGNVRCQTDSTEMLIGFVEAVQTTRTTLWIDCAALGIYKPPVLNLLDLLVVPTGETTLEEFSQMGLAVYGRTNLTSPIYWIPDWCVDCRASGGTKNKPEGWPTPHI